MVACSFGDGFFVELWFFIELGLLRVPWSPLFNVPGISAIRWIVGNGVDGIFSVFISRILMFDFRANLHFPSPCWSSILLSDTFTDNIHGRLYEQH